MKNGEQHSAYGYIIRDFSFIFLIMYFIIGMQAVALFHHPLAMQNRQVSPAAVQNPWPNASAIEQLHCGERCLIEP
jgi:hypothetical protein